MSTAINPGNTLSQPARRDGEGVSVKNKVLAGMAAGVLLVGAAFGEDIAKTVGGWFGSSHDTAAALAHRYGDVVGEVEEGKLDPKQLTRIVVEGGGLAYNVASRIETGESNAIDPSDPLVNEVIHQGDATWSNTQIEPGTSFIVERSQVAGGAPSLVQEARDNETVTIK